jgi:integrase
MLTNTLTAKAVANMKDGKYRDGQGLQFEVKGGSRRWTFSYMFEGRQREVAIGRYPAMSLADARAKRAELRESKDRGLDPKRVLAGTVPTNRAVSLRQDIDTFLSHMQGQWRTGHLKEWRQSVDRLAGPLMDKATSDLTQDDVLSAIKPAWGTTNETARRVLGRIEQTIEHAMAIDPGRFTGPTPCNNVLRHLPRVSAEVKPRAAMPWRDLPTFFSMLHQWPGPDARALEFLLLTCCPRTGEIITAAWSEIDGDKWHVPASHMKSGEGRTIPLIPAATALLSSIKPDDASPMGLIFGSRRRGGSGRQTEDAMQVLLRNKMHLRYTVHGFRSSFMDWVAEAHPDRLMAAERALDHKVGNRVQRAYLRTNLLDQRRQLAELWGALLAPPQADAQPEAGGPTPTISLT